MSDIALKVEGLTKEYRLGTIGYGTMREDLQTWWARVRGKDDPNSLITAMHHSESEKKHFLALDDINFEIKKGDRVGIIGRNGAGKSTLLKILSRITSPTKGNIYIDGRIGSLLEVGTGFHQELTGRENIYLNGSILGMKKREIDKRLDEIVDFAGIEKFIDTPVKRYSSGMFVRLGFAVAAHLEPEILIVDEVLAVGDAEFQKKAIGKMEDVSNNEGRTILFVSHQMNSIKNLCNKCIVLNKGCVDFTGDTSSSINHYLTQSRNTTETQLANRTDRIGTGEVVLTSIDLLNNKNEAIDRVLSGQEILVRIGYQTIAMNKNDRLSFSISVKDQFGAPITDLSSDCSNIFNNQYHKKSVICKLLKLPLNKGLYSLNLIVRKNGEIADWIIDVKSLIVESGDYYGNGRIPDSNHSSILFEYCWMD